MYLVMWLDGHRKNFLYEEQDHGVAAWSLRPDDAIIFDTLAEAVESMLDVKGTNLRELNVVPYITERIPE
jgi:hypothetical protein